MEKPTDESKVASPSMTHVRMLISDYVSGLDEVRIPEIVQMILLDLQSNPELLDSFLSEQLKPIVYQITLARFAAGRRKTISLGDLITTPTKLQDRADKLQARWSNWWEHVEDRHVKLFAMRRGDLLIAAKERRARATSELELARLWELLADRLPDGKTVGEFFSPEQIETYRKNLKEAFTTKDEEQSA